MTAPSYTEDLTDIATGDEASGWIEFSGNSYNAQGAPAYEDNEYPYIQGNYAVTQDCTKDASIGSLGYDYGSTISLPTDGAFLVWQAFSSPFVLGTYAQGGFRVVVGDDAANFEAWYVGGQDKGRYPYGGFECHAVNTTISYDDAAGTKTIDRYVGGAVYVITGPSKGEPHQVDVMRFGRCSAIFEYGDLTNGYCTTAGFAAQNDNQSNRWGLIEETPGGYLWQGRWQLGTVSNAVDFRDSDVTVFVRWTPKVTVNFNLIEIINSSSNVEMTGFTFQVLDTTTASPGRFLMTDPATVALDTCTFIDMDTFVFNYSSNPVTVDDCVFRRCGEITSGGATFSGCIFDSCTDAVCITTSSPANAALITDSTFISSGTGHGIEITGTAANITLTNLDFVGYDTDNPGTAANKAIYVNIATGSMTITISGGSGVTQSYHVRTAGCVVTIDANVTVTFTGLKDNSEIWVFQTGVRGEGNEIAHTEDATTGTEDNRSYQFSVAATTVVDYIIHCFEEGDEIYETIEIDGYTVPSNDISIPIKQRIDRNAEN